jgi:hypothetical protein
MKRTTGGAAAVTALMVVALCASSALATPINEPPPAGAILDLGGGETGTPAQLINHDSSSWETESVSFVAGVGNTAITLAFRDDPAYTKSS